MTTRSYRVRSSEGLHARPATTLAKIANQYDTFISNMMGNGLTSKVSLA